MRGLRRVGDEEEDDEGPEDGKGAGEEVPIENELALLQLLIEGIPPIDVHAAATYRYFHGLRGPPALPRPKLTRPESMEKIPVAEYHSPIRVACSD